jgi:hypothetical protein
MDNIEETQVETQEEQPIEVPQQQEEPQEKPATLRESLKQALNKNESIAEEPEQIVEEPQAEAIQPIVAPADMNKAEREAFTKNPVLQQYLSRRAYDMRAEVSRQYQELQNHQNYVNEIRQTFEPYKETFEGMSEKEVLSNALEWDKAFRDDPMQAAWEYLSVYGIHPQDLLQHNYQPKQPEYLTRQEAEALAQQQAQSKIDEYFQKKEQEHLVSANYDAVQSFVKDKPLFRDPGTASQVEAEMAPIVAALKSNSPQAPAQEILEKAYQMVIAGNPAFSDLVSKLNAKPRIEQKAAVAQKAKMARRSITGSPGSGSPKIHGTTRDILRLKLNGAA